MKAISHIIAVFLLSCSSKSPAEPEQQIQVKKADTSDVVVNDEDWSGLPEPVFITDPGQKSILGLQDTLYLGDTLTLTFRTPHPRDLAVHDPDNHFFFLVYAPFGSDLLPLVDYERFADLDRLDIITTQTKANPWRAGAKEHQLIFTKTGTYHISLSENLETDDGTPVEREKVYYIAEPRRERDTPKKERSDSIPQNEPPVETDQGS